MRKEKFNQHGGRSKVELIDLVSRLIRINSENPTGTQRKWWILLRSLRRPVFTRNRKPGLPCVVARMGSEDGYSLIFNGHVDVVRREH